MTQVAFDEGLSPLRGDKVPPDSDDLLLARWRSTGSREAIEELIQRYLRPIRRFVYQMVLHDAAADDLTQEVFLRALQGLAGFAGRARFSTWLFQIASNVTLTHLKRAAPEKYGPEIQPRSDCGRAEQPVEGLIRKEALNAVEHALNGLSPKLRSALVLTCLHGKSTEEVAQIQGCETATIYSRVHEARKQLKVSLGDLLT